MSRAKMKTGVEKTCSKCGFTGDSSLFRTEGLACLKCHAAYSRENRANNPERRERDKKYVQEHKPEHSAYNHKYYLEHKDESLARCRKNRALKKLAYTEGGARAV